MTTQTRRRALGVVAGAGLLGAVLGTTGASLALWSDDVTVTGTIASGHEHFAVGQPGADLTPGATVTFPIDAAHAVILAAERELAVPIQVDAVSQGNKGLHYTLTIPDWGEGIFGHSQPEVFPVGSAAECVPDATAPADRGTSSTPVSAAAHDTQRTEYWCLVARFLPPDEGSYTNTATVTGHVPGTEVTVRGSDSWGAEVRTALDPAAEPVHHLTFTATTFRPGQEPRS